MPTYTYVCKQCDVSLERIVKIDDRDKQICNDCQNDLNRGIDAPGAVWAPSSSSGGLRV